MYASDTEEQRKRWDHFFRELAGRTFGDNPWLEERLEILQTARDAPVLELGCGGGTDARFLTEREFSVIATDFSEQALRLTGQAAPSAEVRRVDMTLGLPFADAAFGVIVANLSLHYFPWDKTVEVVGEVHRCLMQGGYLLARLNSTRDRHYASVRKKELERNFYLVDGMPKRLFDRESIEALFAEGWELERAEERTTERYGEPKVLWDLVVRKFTGRMGA